MERKLEDIILKINNLSFGYTKNNLVLNNISFNLKRGEFLGIIGPNGVGKTTLLKNIARILVPTVGTIQLNNKNIFEYTLIEYAQQVSFATKITDYSLKYSVKDFLSLARFPYYKVDENIEDVLWRKKIYSEFKIEQFENKHLNELSSGELQRIIIVQGLLQTPKLLLLDEPTSHLDISQQIKILDFIKRINLEEKISVISIFHDLNLASEYCDRIILLFNGEIKSIGDANNVMNYKVLEQVYNTTVVIVNNPISKKPYVFPVPFMWKEKRF